MSDCAHCGKPIIPGERMVAHMDNGPTWMGRDSDGYQILVTPQPMDFTPYHERCFKAAIPPATPDPQEGP